MGRLVRSGFVVIGVFAWLLAYSGGLQALRLEPGARAPSTLVYLAMQLLCVGFIVALQEPLFAPTPDDARPAGWRDCLWRAPELAFGLLLFGGGVSAVGRSLVAGALAAALGGFIFVAALRRPVPPPKPAKPAHAALAALFGVLQIYPGAVAALSGLYDVEAGDRAEFGGVGALMLLAGVGFIVSGLRRLQGALVAPETLIEG